MSNNQVKVSFFNALGTAAYIVLVSLFLSNAQNIFGKDQPDNFLMPAFMITIFVISAAITGYLVLSKPLRLVSAGQIKEAVTLFFWTLGWLLIFAVIVAILMIVI